MRVQELVLLYGLAAVIVGVALYQQGRSHWLFGIVWPLALPGLLARADERFETTEPRVEARTGATPMERLQRALDLFRVGTDVAPLGSGLADLEGRLVALDGLLADPDLRDGNRRALRELRERLHGEHQSALDRIDDLVTAIHLAHYGGQPPEHLEEQLADLLARVEGVAEVQWIP